MRLRLVMALALMTMLIGVSNAETNLNGAGATFPNPIYQKWFSEYHNAHGDVQINYQSIGSGGGIANLMAVVNHVSETTFSSDATAPYCDGARKWPTTPKNKKFPALTIADGTSDRRSETSKTRPSRMFAPTVAK